MPSSSTPSTPLSHRLNPLTSCPPSNTGIKVIFDLRSENEIKRDGLEWAGVEADNPDPFAAHSMKREWVPVFAKEDYGPEQVGLRYKNYTRAGTEGFVIAYRDISASAPSAYSAIFRHLAQPKPTPCVVHCTAGKDRTGVVVALMLMLVGVEDEKIAEEYSLTDLGLAPLKPLFIERLIRNPALEGNREGVGNMVSSKKENMAATIVMLRKEYGSAEGYMKDKCGMSEEEIARLRKNLLA